jgi:alkylation response protein AidB-like acyl-CoA dehydrogenase
MQPQELITSLRALQPLLARNAGETERARKPADANIEAIAATNVFRFFVPRRYGGYEMPLEAFVDVGLALAEGCVSTAWVTTFCMEHNWMLAQFPAAAQEEIFGSQPYVIAPAAISPNGRAKAHDGGYLLSGRWQWGTGAMHADWIMLAGMVQEADGIAGGEMRMFILPRAEVAIIDTWHVDGMAGTGSNDMQVQDVFVPAHRSQPLGPMSMGRGEGATLHGTRMYRMPMMPILYLAAGVPAVGAARGALKRFIERAPQRTKFGTNTRQSESAETHIRIGHAQGRLDMAELVCRRIAAETEAWGERDETCPLDERLRHRLLMVQAVRTARDVVRDLFEASGANAHHLDEPLQRSHRDLHTIAAHAVFDGELVAEQMGRAALGLPPTVRL